MIDGAEKESNVKWLVISKTRCSAYLKTDSQHKVKDTNDYHYW